ERSARRGIRHRNLIGPAAPVHPADGNRPPVAQTLELGAEQFEVAHTVKLRIVRHAGRAIAEPELGAQVERDVGAALGGGTTECAPDAPLVDRERPLDLAPGGARRFRRGCTLSDPECSW